MPVESIIQSILEDYGRDLWMAFVILVVTGFAMTMIRDFISDLVMYYRAKSSDIGYGQRVYWRGKLYVVFEIRFRYLTVLSETRKLRIPLKTYLTGGIEFPRVDTMKIEDSDSPPST